MTGAPIDWVDSIHLHTEYPVVFRLPINDLTTFPDWLFANLTPIEKKRADRFRQSADRVRFLAGRAMLRWAGARCMGLPVQTIELTVGTAGKPAFTHAADWHINLSHTGSWVLLAIDRQPIGVDVEWERPDLLIDSLLPSAFSLDEQAYIRAETNPKRAFLHLWTRKEALLKATGLGLVDELNQVPSLDGLTVVSAQHIGSGGDWEVYSFSVDESYPAAVAYRRINKLPVFFTLTASDLQSPN